MLLFCDSFDTYALTNVLGKWTNGNVGQSVFQTPGRNGYGNFIEFEFSNGQFITKALAGGPYSTLTIGTAFLMTASAFQDVSIWTFEDSNATLLCNLHVYPDGSIGLKVNSTDVGRSAPGALVLNTWSYIEAQITFSNTTAGSVTIRVNQQQVGAAASVQTAANGNGCSLSGPSSTGSNSSAVSYDDIYILNSTSPNNTFLGNSKIEALMPTGAGRVTAFSEFPNTGANWQKVNEIPPDGDTTYVFASAATTADAYTVTALSNVANVIAVQEFAWARGSDTPSKVLALGVGNGSTENYDAGHNLNNSYNYVLRELDINPITSSPWLPADFSTIQAAIKVIS